MAIPTINSHRPSILFWHGISERGTVSSENHCVDPSVAFGSISTHPSGRNLLQKAKYDFLRVANFSILKITLIMISKSILSVCCLVLSNIGIQTVFAHDLAEFARLSGRAEPNDDYTCSKTKGCNIGCCGAL